MMVRSVTEFDDIQALVRSGFGQLDEAVFLLLQITDAAAAKAWLSRVASTSETGYRITTAADLDDRQDNALQIALTAPGLRALGVEEDVVSRFSREFHDGMASEAAETEGRPRRLGDQGANAPANWEWGAGRDVPDALLMLYGTLEGLAPFVSRVSADIAAGFVVSRAFKTTYKKRQNGDRVEHFGFIDGISQPVIDWKAKRSPGERDEMEYGNLVTPGEFLLGYTNEYGLYEDRPLLTPEKDPFGVLIPAEDEPEKRDLARNGSYLVFRQLEQDVGGFWRFLSARAPDNLGVALAEAMVGRSLATGEPLIPASVSSIAGIGQSDVGRNGFTFDSDPDGLSCPFGAHIRRANPRTADIPGGQQGFISRALRMLGFKHGGSRDDLISSARFHRILRRGRAYGSFVDPEIVARSDDIDGAVGLHFICLNASISRQFEFIQNAWLANPTFNGMSGESDPLLGNRLEFPAGHPTDGFTMPHAAGPNRRVSGMPQFVTVRGGAYFFLPSLRALRFFAR